MVRGRSHPAWLVRRNYFKRVARWMKPRRRPDAGPVAPALVSNVVPFREAAKGVRRVSATVPGIGAA